MHPSFGVPWPRLERAAARLKLLHPAPSECPRVSTLLFLCGLKYLLTYREATGRRLSHYLDDGLREAVEHTLPALMRRAAELRLRPRTHGSRLPVREDNPEFFRLHFGFECLHERLPAATMKWVASHEANWTRLAFGLGVAARFAPETHVLVREMLRKPLALSTPVLDVVASFRWDPDWSLALRA